MNVSTRCTMTSSGNSCLKGSHSLQKPILSAPNPKQRERKTRPFRSVNSERLKSDKTLLCTRSKMPFQFSFSSSAAIVTTASVNGRETTKGVAYRREAYSNEHGTGVRTTKQKLGQDPIVKTRMYDRDGRPLLIEDSSGAGGPGRSRASQHRQEIDDSRRIEDVTDEETVENGIQRQREAWWGKTGRPERS
ncbi:hypothetical protein V8F20_006414 [Naviculisporaceae sp. PSN 640]